MEHVNSILIAATFIAAVIVYLRGTRRRAVDVLDDLEFDYLETQHNRFIETASPILKARSSTFSDEALLDMGILNAADRRRFKTWRTLFPLLVAGIAMLVVAVFFSVGPQTICILAFICWSFGVFVFSIHARSKARTFKRQLEFYLPLVMERIVMAVQAGLDVLPAIQAVLSEQQPEDHVRNSNHQARPISELDPVSFLLDTARRLTERGMGFERSLNEIAGRIKSSALRHAFIHLGLAQRDGGELLIPLRELSDSTQLYYQECVEEEIARMPIKATMPLLCTFAGLIICFITSPIIQIISITKNSLPN